jgi:hypothetical protein
MARQVQDQTAYARGAFTDPVRAVNPYTPSELVTTGAPAQLPVLGIAIVAGLVLWFEHMRRKKGR